MAEESVIADGPAIVDELLVAKALVAGDAAADALVLRSPVVVATPGALLLHATASIPVSAHSAANRLVLLDTGLPPDLELRVCHLRINFRLTPLAPWSGRC